MSLVLNLDGRGRFAARYATRHLAVSAAVAAVAAIFVFNVWYPAPAHALLKVGHIYGLVLVVDVVCGPLLTLVLAAPGKSTKELAQDLGLVALIQISALGYGLFALEAARPVAYVFEQDRLVLVSKNELYMEGCPLKSSCSEKLGSWRIRNQIAKAGQAGDDHLRSLDLSLQGVSPAMRPDIWSDWNWRDPKLQSALRPLSVLRSDRKKQLVVLRGTDYLTQPDLRYLPLVSSKTLDWIAVFDGQGRLVDSLPVDGFE